MNVCLPVATPVSVSGEAHGANAPPSIEHSEAAPSSPVHVNLAVLAVIVPSGAPIRAGAAGAAVSTVHVWLSGVASAWAAALSARTWNVC